MSHTAKYALADSMKKLLSKYTLDKITVKDIVEDCGVNRQTFYYHFQDIYDLLGFVFRQEAQNVLKEKRTHDTWQQGFLDGLNYALQHRTLVINAYNSVGREHLESYLYAITYDLLIKVAEEEAEGIFVLQEDKEYIAHFYKYAFVGIVLEWISKGMKTKPEQIIDKLSRFLDGSFRQGLLKFSFLDKQKKGL